MERFAWTYTANIVETGVKKAVVALKGLQTTANSGILFQNGNFDAVFG